MNPHISVSTLGVKDLSRAKQFYSEGLGWPVQVDQGHFVSFSPAGGSAPGSGAKPDGRFNDGTGAGASTTSGGAALQHGAAVVSLRDADWDRLDRRGIQRCGAPAARSTGGTGRNISAAGCAHWSGVAESDRRTLDRPSTRPRHLAYRDRSGSWRARSRY